MHGDHPLKRMILGTYIEEKVAGVHRPPGLVRIPADALENAIIIPGQHEEDRGTAFHRSYDALSCNGGSFASKITDLNCTKCPMFA
jgi:hypothetical protein